MTVPIQYPYPTHEYDYEETIHPPATITTTGPLVAEDGIDEETEKYNAEVNAHNAKVDAENAAKAELGEDEQAFVDVCAALRPLDYGDRVRVLQAVKVFFDLE